MERWLAESRFWMAGNNRTFVVSNSRYFSSPIITNYPLKSISELVDKKNEN